MQCISQDTLEDKSYRGRGIGFKYSTNSGMSGVLSDFSKRGEVRVA